MAFCVQSCFHTLSKKLDASTNGHDPSFGFDIATDELYNRAYISDVADKSCAAKMLSSRKAARNKIRGAYIVCIDSERVLSRRTLFVFSNGCTRIKLLSLLLKLRLKNVWMHQNVAESHYRNTNAVCFARTHRMTNTRLLSLSITFE